MSGSCSLDTRLLRMDLSGTCMLTQCVGVSCDGHVTSTDLSMVMDLEE